MKKKIRLFTVLLFAIVFSAPVSTINVGSSLSVKIPAATIFAQGGGLPPVGPPPGKLTDAPNLQVNRLIAQGGGLPPVGPPPKRLA